MEGNGKASAISSAFVYISVEQSVRPIHVNHYLFDRQSVCLASRGDDLLYVHGIHKKSLISINYFFLLGLYNNYKCGQGTII